MSQRDDKAAWFVHNGPLAAHELLGAWKVTVKSADGTEMNGKALFNKDGTYVLSDEDKSSDADLQKGRFAYANGILWLIDSQGAASLKLAWSSGQQFRCTRNKIDLVFER